MIDKRVFSRYEVNFDCYLAFPGDMRVYQATLLDLSLTGMRLLTDAPLKPGLTISFSFTSDPPVKGKARVVWIKTTNQGTMAGLEIVKLKERFVEALHKVINDLTLQHLPDAYLR